MAKNDTTSIFNLVIKELTKVLHMHFALVGINNGSKSVKLRSLDLGTLNRLYNVRKLAYSRGLDKNSVGCILAYDFF